MNCEIWKKKKTCHKPARIGLCPWKQDKFEGHGFSNSLFSYQSLFYILSWVISIFIWVFKNLFSMVFNFLFKKISVYSFIFHVLQSFFKVCLSFYIWKCFLWSKGIFVSQNVIFRKSLFKFFLWSKGIFVSRNVIFRKSLFKLSCVCLSLGKLVNEKHFPVKRRFDLVSIKVFFFYFGWKILSASCEKN